MLGIMDKNMEAKSIDQPPEVVPQLGSTQAPVKAKSATIDMFFKSPPKHPAKPVIKSPTILGYFKSNSKTDVTNSHKGTVNGSTERGDEKAEKSNNIAEKRSGDFGKKKKTSKSESKSSKTSKIDKDAAKTKKIKSVDKGSKTDKGTTSTELLEKNGSSSTADDGVKDRSLEDFDTAKPEKRKKRKKLLVIDDDDESEEEVLPKVTKLTTTKEDSMTDKIAPSTCSTVEISYQDYIETEEPDKDGDGIDGESEDVTKTEDTANSSLTISYADFLSQGSDTEDVGEEEERHNVRNNRNNNMKNHQSTELSDVDMVDAAADSQESMDTGTTSDEDVFQDSEAESASRGNRSRDSTENSDIDTVMTVSLAASPERNKSQKAQFAEFDKIQKKKPVSSAIKPQQKQKLTEIQPVKLKKVEPSKKALASSEKNSADSKLKKEEPSKKVVAPSEKHTTDSQQEDEDDNEDELDIPKRREVKVTAQIHTPPLVTPSTSPSSSPSSNRCKLKSNVVVDSADMDLIHVEESDVTSKSVKKAVTFVSAGSSTPPNSRASSKMTIKPAPTKLFSIFQKKSIVKDASNDDDKKTSQPKKPSEGTIVPQTTITTVDPVSKQTTFNIAPKDDGKQSKEKTTVPKKTAKSKEDQTATTDSGTTDKEADDKSTQKAPESKRTKDEASKGKSKCSKKDRLSLRGKDSASIPAKAGQTTTAGVENKQTVSKTESKKTADKPSLGKRKAQDADTPESGRSKRRLSGRAAAIKARKDILQQELQDAAGSESATSQEEVACPKKKSLKQLFPSDTDGSEMEDGNKKKGQQTKLKQSKMLMKQKAVSNDTDGDEENATSDVVKRKRGRPSKGLEGPIMTSSPKVNKDSMKKAKARQLLQKAKNRQSSTTTRTSPSKRKKTGTKSSNDDTIEILDSSNDKTPAKSKSSKTRTPAKNKTPAKTKTPNKSRTPGKSRTPAKTKTLRNFNDVLGKKVVAKELDVKKKSTGKNKETKMATKKDNKMATKKDSKMATKETKKSQENTVQVEKPRIQAKEKKKLSDAKSLEPPVQDKVPAKICPLFTKEGRLAAAKKQAEIIQANTQDTSETLIILSDDENSCDSRMSNGGGGDSSGPISFSGLFGSSKRSELDRRAQELPYPAFPSVSHVRQEEKGVGPNQSTNLPPMTKETLSPLPVPPLSVLNLGMVSLCNQERKSDFVNLKDFAGHEEFSSETQKVLLEDIGKNNPKVPVRKLFKRYLAKRRGDPPPSNKPAADKSEPNSKYTKLKGNKVTSGKRKSEAIIEESEGANRRKRSRQDPNDEEKDGGRASRSRRSGRSKPAAEPTEIRRSSRRASKGKVEEVKGQEEVKAVDGKSSSPAVVEKDEATIKAEKLASLMWTEKYQPTCAGEVMGNGNSVKKLGGWMSEWRKKFVKEKKKMKKQQMKGAAGKGLTDEVNSEDDFDMSGYSDDSDSDYSDEEDFLCNTMMVVGPTGAGKTAAVYACAQEHGFKIFEVNASSRRVGRQILAELGEATQSHHVATKPGVKMGINNFFTPGPKMSPSKSPAKKKKEAEQRKKPPMPKAFANFFKTITPQGKKDPPKNTTKKKKGKEELPPAVTMTTKKKTDSDTPVEKTVPSTSIILFEEVDVVFEEDKGFHAAIANFMETTKRPIILTTSDPKFASKFEGQYEALIFKRPTPTLLSTHLQLLALAENVFTSPQDMNLVAQHLDCDIRKSVLALQYWISSGAKLTCRTQNGGIDTDAKVTEQNSVSRNSHSDKDVKEIKNHQVNDDTSRTDKLVKKLVDLESKIIVIGEYYAKKERRPSLEERYEELMHDEASRHDCCLESIMGVCNQTGVEEDVRNTLQLPESPSSLTSRALVAQSYQHHTKSEVTYNNYYYLLQQPKELCTQTVTPSICNTPRLGKRLVSNTATFLDHLSFMDANFPPVHDGMPKLGCPSDQGWWQARFRDSMLDLAKGDDERTGYRSVALQSEIRSTLEVLSFGLGRRRHQRLMKHSDEKTGSSKNEGADKRREDWDDQEDILPCDSETNMFRLRALEIKCPEVYPTVVQRLPYHVYCGHQSMACDYLPAIRQICRSERWRQEAQLKRRFLHYLDFQAMSLKATDYLKLASALDVHPTKPPQEDSFLSAI